MSVGPATPLSKTMTAMIEQMRHQEGHIWRHPGGFWGAKTWGYPSWNSSTVAALVARGVAAYDEWKDGHRFRFPVRATLTERK